MPDIGVIHPQVVHFVVALAFVGVGARVASILPLGDRFKFANPMATVLIVLAALAGLMAVQSGTDAHGPVERVPGARDAVVEHEDAGKLAKNVLLGLAVLELAALALSGNAKLGKGLRVVATVGGLGALYTVYEAAEHGGELVYAYAGGVGIRSGDSADVRRLLVAALYHNAMQSRASGDSVGAARLVTELRRQAPHDQNVYFLSVESMIRDEHNPRGALTELAALNVPATDVRLTQRKATLTAEAYGAIGVRDSARATLEVLKRMYPDNPRVGAAADRAIAHLDSLPVPAAPPAPMPTPGKRN